jgi:mono/diheme cytochrome c family protein
VHFSTQYMREEDLNAMAAYLFDLDRMPETRTVSRALAPAEIAAPTASAAKATYSNLCAGCHGADGQGLPHVSVPLATNVSLRLTSPRNLIRSVLHGIPAQQFPGLERMEPMPGFADLLDDQAVADLVNWLRSRWGGQRSEVTAADVAKQR